MDIVATNSVTNGVTSGVTNVSGDVLSSNNPVSNEDNVVSSYERDLRASDRDTRDRVLVELRAEGKTYKDIQRITGLHPQVISRYLQRAAKSLKAALHLPQYSHSKIIESIQAAAPAAVNTISQLSERSKKDDVRLRASADILDRAGFKPVERTININAVEDMSGDELKRMARSMLSGPLAQSASGTQGATHQDAINATIVAQPIPTHSQVNVVADGASNVNGTSA